MTSELAKWAIAERQFLTDEIKWLKAGAKFISPNGDNISAPKLDQIYSAEGRGDGMSKKWTHTEAFASFGTSPRNARWSWSARNEESGIVVATLWQDQFSKRGDRQIYERQAFTPEQRKRPGFSEWVENLTWAQDHCDGRFHVISAIAKDITADPRSIRECFPTKMIMRLVDFDPVTGAFTAEAV